MIVKQLAVIQRSPILSKHVFLERDISIFIHAYLAYSSMFVETIFLVRSQKDVERILLEKYFHQDSRKNTSRIHQQTFIVDSKVAMGLTCSILIGVQISNLLHTMSCFHVVTLVKYEDANLAELDTIGREKVE